MKITRLVYIALLWRQGESADKPKKILNLQLTPLVACPRVAKLWYYSHIKVMSYLK